MRLDTGRRVGVASKTDAAIVHDMLVSQLRWTGGKTEGDYYVLRLGRLDALNGPAAYLFPTYDAADRVLAETDAAAMSRGIDREISITPPTNLSPQALEVFNRLVAA